MEAMASLVYSVIKFPHQGKVVTIDQLSFYHRDSAQAKPHIHMIDNSTKDFLNVGIGLYSTLMGIVNLPLPEVCMISHVGKEPSGV